MALPTITQQDFKGYVKLTLDRHIEEDFNDFVEQFYGKYVREILNVTAYQEILADGTQQKWVDLFGETAFTNLDGDVDWNDGLKNVIIRFLYFHWVTSDFVNTAAGNVKPAFENSIAQSGGNNAIACHLRRNDGIDMLCSVYRFIRAFEKVERTVLIVVDNLDATWTVTVSDTKYLYHGDLVKHAETEYEAGEVLEDSMVLPFEPQVGDVLAWYPFKDFNLKEYEYGCC